jgi:hypothetical protein
LLSLRMPCFPLSESVERRQTRDVRRMRSIHLELWGNKAAFGGARLDSGYILPT